MINILDQLAMIKNKFVVAADSTSQILNGFVQNVDSLIDVAELKPGEQTNLSLGDALVLVNALNTLNDKTLTLADGKVLPFKVIGDTLNVGDQIILKVTKPDNSLQDVLVITNRYVDPDNPQVYFRGFGDSLDSDFGTIIEVLSSNFTCSDIVQTAINLACKGDLNPSNFMAAISDYSSNLSSDAKSIVEQIKLNVSGADALSQGTSLLLVLKNVCSGVTNATSDDANQTLQFNDTDYSVNTSILFPLNQLIPIASQVLGSILRFISPILGGIVYTLGSAISSGLQAINENDGFKFKYVAQDERDNDCFALPIVQVTLSQDKFPQIIRDYVTTYGQVKTVNGLYTCYIWPAEVDHLDTTSYNFEVFTSGLADLNKYAPETDALYQFLTDPTSCSYISVNHQFVFDTRTPSQFINIISYWLDSLAEPGGLGMTFEECQCRGEDYTRSLAFRRMFGNVLLAGLEIAGIFTNGNTYTISDGDLMWGPVLLDIFHGRNENIYLTNYTAINESQTSCLNTIFTHFALYNKNYTSINNLSLGYESVTKYASPNICNSLYPAVARLAKIAAVSHGDDLVAIFLGANPSEAQFTNSLTDSGASSTSVIIPSFSSKCNPYVLPPNQTFSIWSRIALGVVITAAVSITAFAVKMAVKRKIQYKAWARRKQLESQIEAANNSGSYSDYRSAYKAVNRYNRFYGRLTGTSYDMNNKWIDYREATSLADTSLLNKVLGPSAVSDEGTIESLFTLIRGN